MSTRIRKFKEHPCKRCGETITNSRSEFCDECWPRYMELRDLYRVSCRLPVRTGECPVCHKVFYTKRTDRKYCSENCQYEVEREAARVAGIRKRANMSPEKRQHVKEYMKEYRIRNKDDLSKKNKEWKANQGEEFLIKRREQDKLYREKHREEISLRAKKKTIRNRQEKAGVRQDDLIARYGVDLSTDARVNTEEFVDTLGIRRINGKWCLCLKCNNLFIDDHFPQALYDAVRTGRNICPNCGDSPLGVSSISGPQMELHRMYPELSVMNYRPEWMEGMELDLFSPDKKLAIEFHGTRWHSSLTGKTTAHRHKADLCEANGVQLIQLYETEWVNRRDQVIDKLDAIFHRDMTRVYARKLELREMNGKADRDAVNDFMERNHIQGHSSSQWACGLWLGASLVAVCTFKYGTGYASGGQLENTGKYWELNRYATGDHLSVIGGLSRCIKAFERSHQDVHTIVSFADRRWTCPTRSAYSSSGFVEKGRVEANYQYTDLNPEHGLRNKQYMRKSAIENRAKMDPSGPEAKVFSWDKTESVMAKELGWYKIYDAGKIRYEIEINT